MTINKFKEEVCTNCTHCCNCDNIVNVKMCDDYINSRMSIFTDNKTKVIAVSHYKGNVIKGVAKCHPDDAFDYKIGKKLAIAKCNMRIAELRLKDSSTKIVETARKELEISKEVEKYSSYNHDATMLYNNALETLNNLTK